MTRPRAGQRKRPLLGSAALSRAGAATGAASVTWSLRAASCFLSAGALMILGAGAASGAAFSAGAGAGA